MLLHAALKVSFHHGHMARGVCIDAMNGIYLGITRMLMNLWFYTSSTAPWYRNIKEVDLRLMSICPPTEISKDIRSSNDLKYWKGNDFDFGTRYIIFNSC
jgi:hypothetical protein